MNLKQTDSERILFERMAEEEKIRSKVDKDGIRWNKVYCGGGIHFQNWLNQVIEVKGKANVEIEETDSTGFQCYQETGEKMYRIWVRDNEIGNK